MFLESFKSQASPLMHAQMKRMHLGDVVFKKFGLCIVCLLAGTKLHLPDSA